MGLRKIKMTPEFFREYLGEVLEAVCKDEIPRIICGEDDLEIAAVVSAAGLDRLVEAAEEAAEMKSEPLRVRYERHMKQLQGERDALLDQIGRMADEIAAMACPKCRRAIRERYVGGRESLGEVWQRLTGGDGDALLAQRTPPEVIVTGTAVEGGEAPGV